VCKDVHDPRNGPGESKGQIAQKAACLQLNTCAVSAGMDRPGLADAESEHGKWVLVIAPPQPVGSVTSWQ
jgi:hypothetical protein